MTHVRALPILLAGATLLALVNPPCGFGSEPTTPTTKANAAEAAAHAAALTSNPSLIQPLHSPALKTQKGIKKGQRLRPEDGSDRNPEEARRAAEKHKAKMNAAQSRLADQHIKIEERQRATEDQQARLLRLQSPISPAQKQDDQTRREELERERRAMADAARRPVKAGAIMEASGDSLLDEFIALGAEDPNDDPESQAAIQDAQQELQQKKKQSEEKKSAE